MYSKKGDVKKGDLFGHIIPYKEEKIIIVPNSNTAICFKLKAI